MSDEALPLSRSKYARYKPDTDGLIIPAGPMLNASNGVNHQSCGSKLNTQAASVSNANACTIQPKRNSLNGGTL